jgi:hypothetical protein
MNIKIRSWETGGIVYVGDHQDTKTAVEYCVKNKIILTGADLTEANLYGANLYGANLTRVNLTRVNLTEANLTEANLTEANLTRVNLTEANLYGANLTRANLTRANLTRAKYSILSTVRINLGKLSDDLTLELMRWDAITCGMDNMDAWAAGGQCPFSKSHFCREFFFTENKEVWVAGNTTMNHRQLWEAIAKEKNITI